MLAEECELFQSFCGFKSETSRDFLIFTAKQKKNRKFCKTLLCLFTKNNKETTPAILRSIFKIYRNSIYSFVWACIKVMNTFLILFFKFYRYFKKKTWFFYIKKIVWPEFMVCTLRNGYFLTAATSSSKLEFLSDWAFSVFIGVMWKKVMAVLIVWGKGLRWLNCA